MENTPCDSGGTVTPCKSRRKIIIPWITIRNFHFAQFEIDFHNRPGSPDTNGLTKRREFFAIQLIKNLSVGCDFTSHRSSRRDLDSGTAHLSVLRLVGIIACADCPFARKAKGNLLTQSLGSLVMQSDMSNATRLSIDHDFEPFIPQDSVFDDGQASRCRRGCTTILGNPDKPGSGKFNNHDGIFRVRRIDVRPLDGTDHGRM